MTDFVHQLYSGCTNIHMITNIDIDEVIVAQAMQLSGARTKREVVDRALRQMVARASRPSVRELFVSAVLIRSTTLKLPGLAVQRSGNTV